MHNITSGLTQFLKANEADRVTILSGLSQQELKEYVGNLTLLGFTELADTIKRDYILTDSEKNKNTTYIKNILADEIEMLADILAACWEDISPAQQAEVNIKNMLSFELLNFEVKDFLLRIPGNKYLSGATRLRGDQTTRPSRYKHNVARYYHPVITIKFEDNAVTLSANMQSNSISYSTGTNDINRFFSFDLPAFRATSVSSASQRFAKEISLLLPSLLGIT